MQTRILWSNKGNLLKYFTPVILSAIIFLLLWAVQAARCAERTIIEIKDMTQMEVKGGGFTLPRDTRIHIIALGAGGPDISRNNERVDLYAYAWIINADTREKVWLMTRSNTEGKKSDRLFDQDVMLPAGSYEAYFTAYAYSYSSPFSSFQLNIDRRTRPGSNIRIDRPGFLSWLYDLFGEDSDKEWKRRAKQWGITISADESSNFTTFAPPKPYRHVLYESIRMGENEHVTQAFTVSRPMPIRLYALGEMGSDGEPADYAWIVDARTRRRFWQMNEENSKPAGGSEKNVMVNATIDFPPGEYVLYYISDDSHSYVDWNEAPPFDPERYGITMIAAKEGTEKDFSIHEVSEEKNVIVALTCVHNEETRSENFMLKIDADIRIYALGEQSLSHNEMADYGWIINARTREKVWTMDPDRTESAGGASKNRMIDEIIRLPKGTYTVFYQTDDSHAYGSWNASPPFDPEHWGITVSLAGDADMGAVEKHVTLGQTGIIAQIVKVGDNADLVRPFSLNAPAHVRIYALGEGSNRTMVDYGWIENASTGEILWQMTYGMTFHAGGGRKNRLVNTTILLDKGSYKLHYVSDDSHSYNDWNTDPPDDPSMWGITLFTEE